MNGPCFLQVHRLVVVDEQEVVKGIVSLSDILQALVLTDGEEGKNNRGMVVRFWRILIFIINTGSININVISHTYLKKLMLNEVMLLFCPQAQLEEGRLHSLKGRAEQREKEQACKRVIWTTLKYPPPSPVIRLPRFTPRRFPPCTNVKL